jgi:hypothetical protein
VGGAGEAALPFGPHHQEHEGRRQRRRGAHQRHGQQRAQRPGEHRVGRIALHVVHLRDQHDGSAVDGDAGEHGRLAEGLEPPLEQQESAAVAGPQRGHEQAEAGELRHRLPVGGDEAHHREAEQHRPEDGQHRGRTEGRFSGCEVGADRGGARLAHPALGLPAAEVALHPTAIPGHAPIHQPAVMPQPRQDVIDRRSDVKGSNEKDAAWMRPFRRRARRRAPRHRVRSPADRGAACRP